MRKEWHWIGVVGLLLTACTPTTETPQQQPPAQVYNGPVKEISGVEPRYEPYNPSTNQDYKLNGQTYHIVKNPQNFSETGLATTYNAESNGGNTTATGEPFDAQALAAAHPTLPLPSYVRVTNLSNGRQLVVRVNDRGPYTPGRVIDLTEAAADRLNISNYTQVQVDFIQVAPDGTLTGPGTIGTVVAKQSYALPPRPSLGSSTDSAPGQMQSGAAPADDTRVPSAAGNGQNYRPVPNPVSSEQNYRPVPNPASSEQNGSPVPDQEDDSPVPANAAPMNGSANGGGLLGAPKPLPPGVIESDGEGASPSAARMPVSEPQHSSAAAIYTPARAASGSPAAATYSPKKAAAVTGLYVVQVGALADKQRALSWQKTLGQRFGVPGKVTANGNLYRVQLGPFNNRQQALALQQRLTSEARQQSFITTAEQGM